MFELDNRDDRTIDKKVITKKANFEKILKVSLERCLERNVWFAACGWNL